MPNKLKLIIFDMDGVLIDVDNIQKNAVMQTCLEFAIDSTKLDWNDYKWLNSITIFRDILSKVPNSNATIQELVKFKKQITKYNFDNANLIPGSIEFLEFAKITFSKIGLATSSNRITQQRYFDKFQLSNYFDTTITGDEVINSKPDPEIYLQVMTKLKVNPSDTIIIEDSLSGTKAGLLSGAAVFTIATSHTINEIQSWNMANIIVKDYKDLKERIKQLL